MVRRQCSGWGSSPISASRAPQAARWCAPESMSTPSMSKMTATESSSRPPSRAAGEGSGVIGHELEEIPVGVAEVDGGAIDAAGASTRHGADLHGDSMGGQPVDGIADRTLPDEAEILGARHRCRRFGRNRLAGLVNIDHGAARHERGEAPLALPPLVHAKGLAAQHFAIECERRLEVLDDDDDVIEPTDHALFPLPSRERARVRVARRRRSLTWNPLTLTLSPEGRGNMFI